MRQYEVVFFDLDHTLVDTRRQYRLGLAKTIEEVYNGDVPETFIEQFQKHHDMLWGLYDKRQITMAELRRERIVRAWREFGVERSLEEADLFQNTLNATFETTLFPYEDTLQLVEALAKNHRLGIITNGSPDLQDRKMRIVGLDVHFPQETVIISEHVGLAKPDKAVYQAACDKLRVEPQEALMIGDNYRADVAGARSFGMDAIWYVPDPDMVSEFGQKGGELPLTNARDVLARIDALEAVRN